MNVYFVYYLYVRVFEYVKRAVKSRGMLGKHWCRSVDQQADVARGKRYAKNKMVGVVAV